MDTKDKYVHTLLQAFTHLDGFPFYCFYNGSWHPLSLVSFRVVIGFLVSSSASCFLAHSVCENVCFPMRKKNFKLYLLQTFKNYFQEKWTFMLRVFCQSLKLRRCRCRAVRSVHPKASWAPRSGGHDRGGGWAAMLGCWCSTPFINERQAFVKARKSQMLCCF